MALALVVFGAMECSPEILREGVQFVGYRTGEIKVFLIH